MPIILAILLLEISVFAYAQPQQQTVLILNSYDSKFVWAEQITEGIKNVLKESNVRIYLEHMNILKVPQQKSLFNQIHKVELYSMLENKYEEAEFDAIITVDYPAFNFARQYGNNLWGEVPIVSCGLSKQQAVFVDSANSLWSGVYEYYDVPAQIDFINRLQRSIQRIVFITDDSDAGKDIGSQLHLTKSINQRAIKLEEWKKPNWDSLLKSLSHLDPERDAVVLAGTNLSDTITTTHTLWQTLTEYVSEHSKSPVYSFWDVGVQNGVVGGVAMFAPLIGKNTGLLTAAILANRDESYRPGFQRSVNIAMLDEKVAISKNLNLGELPPETIILNKTESWLIGKYKDYMADMWNAIIAELVIILMLGFAFYMYFKRSNRKLLKKMNLFLAKMSHEIRTPLNSLLGFSELLLNKSENLSDEQREWCKSIETSSYHMRDTFNNIMDYSKIEAGILYIEEEWVDLFSLLDDLISVCRHNLLYKNVRLYIMPSIMVPRFIKTDPVKLKQVLVNLINNALKFTSKGSVKLSVTSECDSHDCCKIFFDIKDTGIGIQKEKMKTIFNAFQQIDEGHARKYGGSGLGLSISQNILQALGSKLSVESSENGSRFYFNIVVKTKEKAFYKKYFCKKFQKVAIQERDLQVLDYISEQAETVKAIATKSPSISPLLGLRGQDLLIAEADDLTDVQINRISVLYPRVILTFFSANDKIASIKRDFPKFECLISPIKSNDAIEALQRLYAQVKMTIEESQNEIKDVFATFENPDDKWKYLLKIAKEHEGMDASLKDDKFIVKGCAAKMFLVPEYKNDILYFHMDTEEGESTPLLSRGLGALALKVYNRQKPADILAAKPEFFHEIGLQIGLTPTRANGFASLIKQIYIYAKVYSLVEG
ncbi:MAG: SufE family protein [Fibromonadales bacterium]|nr:SufE family protein [Fibromonadales bacterium]